MNERVTGKIKSWKTEAGYGFAALNGSRDIFIHIRSIRNKPAEMKDVAIGQEVEFEIGPGHEEGQVQGIEVVLL